MKLKEPKRYLKQIGTDFIYIRTENLASRPDMVEFVPEQKQEPKPEPIPEPEATAKPYKIERAKATNESK